MKKILPLFPPHHTYVEPFGGGASVILAKPPSPVEVYNDIDSGLVNLFRVLRDPKQFQEFYRKVSLTPYSREEHRFCLETWENCEDPVEKAYRFFILVRQGFSGKIGTGWSFSVTTSIHKMARATASYLSAIEMLPEISARLLQVQIENKDFREIFAIYDTPRTLFYCDPPYVQSARKDKKVYRYEMSDDDHKELLDILLGIKGLAVVSGYDNPLYKVLDEAGWERYEFETVCFALGRTRWTGVQGKGAALRLAPRTEVVWVKPWRDALNLELVNPLIPDRNEVTVEESEA